MSFPNCQMLDFKCLIIPRFVYSDKTCFNSSKINNAIKDRLEELVDASILLSKALINN